MRNENATFLFCLPKASKNIASDETETWVSPSLSTMIKAALTARSMFPLKQEHRVIRLAMKQQCSCSRSMSTVTNYQYRSKEFEVRQHHTENECINEHFDWCHYTSAGPLLLSSASTSRQDLLLLMSSVTTSTRTLTQHQHQNITQMG